MPGEFIPPEPAPAGNDGPAREPEAAGPQEPSPPTVPAPGTAPAEAGAPPAEAGAPPAGAGTSPADGGAPPPGAWAPPPGAGGPAEVLDSTNGVGAAAPTDQGAEVPPDAPGPPPDPAAITGPPWPRLVAAEGSYTPPRLARWPIVVGILLFAGWVATLVIVPTVSSPSSGYALVATDAHFTATFPARPRRASRAVGTATVIAYTTALANHAIGVTYVALPPSASFSLNAGINGAAQSLPGASIVSRNSLNYLGQPAEDATISSSAGLAQVRVVRFGSSAYVLQAFGSSAASYAHDYNVLLDSFRPQNP